MSIFVSVHADTKTVTHDDTLSESNGRLIVWTAVQTSEGQVTFYFKSKEDRMDFWNTVAQGASTELEP